MNAAIHSAPDSLDCPLGLDESDDLDRRFTDAVRLRVHNGVIRYAEGIKALMAAGLTIGAAGRELAGFGE